ncbi:class B sortase [Alkalibacterium sp. f15]|uniref:class B sortase n=1 Tax=Alkalibacterium sp. f15 TaxID=3414029 RepID=UPI003BF8C6EA
MKRKLLLLGLATAFLLQLNAVVRSTVEQSSTAEVPPLSTSTDDVQIDEASFYSKDSVITEPAADMDEEESDAFTFLSNPSAEYYSLNSDYVGWIEMADTAIDYPVVRGQDNEFYLEHDFYKEEHILGAIFMDYRNVGMGLDDHTILYGHYTKSGLMFADLDKYLSEEYTAGNSTIEFQDPYTKRKYQIFSVHVSPADAGYIRTSFKGNDLEAYYEDLKEASYFPIESEFDPDQKLLTLISCNYTVDDGRIYVHAYEITE